MIEAYIDANGRVQNHRIPSGPGGPGDGGAAVEARALTYLPADNRDRIQSDQTPRARGTRLFVSVRKLSEDSECKLQDQDSCVRARRQGFAPDNERPDREH